MGTQHVAAQCAEWRLDEQALLDMRSARFAPYTENGQPVEWEVIAPMSYEVDR